MISRLASLTSARRALLLRASVVLAAAAIATSILPFRKAIRFGLAPLGTKKYSAADIVWAVELAARKLPWRLVCIQQSLAAQRLLRSSGIKASLHYGACQDTRGGTLDAHVWLTVDGIIILGGEEARHYAQLAIYP